MSWSQWNEPREVKMASRDISEQWLAFSVAPSHFGCIFGPAMIAFILDALLSSSHAWQPSSLPNFHLLTFFSPLPPFSSSISHFSHYLCHFHAFLFRYNHSASRVIFFLFVFRCIHICMDLYVSLSLSFSIPTSTSSRTPTLFTSPTPFLSLFQTSYLIFIYSSNLLSAFVYFYRWPFYKVYFIFHSSLCYFSPVCNMITFYIFSCYSPSSRLLCPSLSRFNFCFLSFLTQSSFRYFLPPFSPLHFKFDTHLCSVCFFLPLFPFFPGLSFFSLVSSFHVPFLFLRFPSLSSKLPPHLVHQPLDPSASGPCHSSFPSFFGHFSFLLHLPFPRFSYTFPFCHFFVLLSSHFHLLVVLHFLSSTLLSLLI